MSTAKTDKTEGTDQSPASANSGGTAATAKTAKTAKTVKAVKHAAFVTAGVVLLLVGLALLVLPGPGLLVVFAGLAILATVFPALDRHVEVVRRQALKAAEDSVSSWWRLTGAVILGFVLIGSGVAWGIVEDLPFSGWHTGSSIILSGLIVLALLVYSLRRVRNAGRAGGS